LVNGPGRAARWYRLGEGTLGVGGTDRSLSRRFLEIYGGCQVTAAGSGPVVTCRVGRPERGRVRIDFEDPEPLDVARFLEAVFPGRGYGLQTGPSGTVAVRLPGTGDDVLLTADAVTAPVDAAWRPLVANLAVSRLLRLQRSLLFFHAASFSVRGRGVLVCGPKRSGKTTLALAFAAAGHPLLGDEVAVLRPADRSLIPFRRSLAIREGPMTAASRDVLEQAPFSTERFPDGERRRRVPVPSVSPGAAPEQVPLTAVLILRHFSAQTEVRALQPGPRLVGLVTPMAVSLWDQPAGALVVRMLRALAGARVFEVHLGPPDDTVAAIERLLED